MIYARTDDGTVHALRGTDLYVVTQNVRRETLPTAWGWLECVDETTRFDKGWNETSKKKLIPAARVVAIYEL